MDPQVVAAVVLGGFTFAGGVGAVLLTNRRLGKPNGHGNLYQMVETLLLHVGGLDEKVEAHIANDDAFAVWVREALSGVVPDEALPRAGVPQVPAAG